MHIEYTPDPDPAGIQHVVIQATGHIFDLDTLPYSDCLGVFLFSDCEYEGDIPIALESEHPGLAATEHLTYTHCVFDAEAYAGQKIGVMLPLADIAAGEIDSSEYMDSPCGKHLIDNIGHMIPQHLDIQQVRVDIDDTGCISTINLEINVCAVLES